MKTVADTLGVARSSLSAPSSRPKRRGRPPADEKELLQAVRVVIKGLQSYGYRRVWAVLKRERKEKGLSPFNHKRVYRVMKAHGLLLQRHSGLNSPLGPERRHDGRVAIAKPNIRWCSDGFEVACDDGARVRIAFVMDCCDRAVISHVATTGGVTGEMIRDLMVEAVEGRFGAAARTPHEVEWLSDNGSCYTALGNPQLRS